MHMKKFLLLTASLTCFLFAVSTAQVSTGTDTQQKAKDTEVKLVSSDIETTVIDIKVNNHQLLSADPSNENLFKVKSGDAVSMLISGAPDLAKIATSIVIPDDAEMQVEVLSSSYTDYENIEIAPSKGNLLSAFRYCSYSYRKQHFSLPQAPLIAAGFSKIR